MLYDVETNKGNNMENKEDQIRVAKLVIVAWVKNWSCLTLYAAIAGKPFKFDDIEELHNKYKFIPQHFFWYGTNDGRYFHKPVKKYIADLSKKLSDALWDTEDNLKKLNFASYLISLDSKNIKSSYKYSKEDRAAHHKDRRNFLAKSLGDSAMVEYKQKRNGSHWTTVK